MKHVLDFFDNSGGNAITLRDERTGGFPRPLPVAIDALASAYRAVLAAYAERAFTDGTVASVRTLHGLAGGPNRTLVDAALAGDTEITGFAERKNDAAPEELTVKLRVRSAKGQETANLAVERAFDALRPAAYRFDRAHPGLARTVRAALDAEGQAPYRELASLAVTPAARRALGGAYGAFGHTARQATTGRGAAA